MNTPRLNAGTLEGYFNDYTILNFINKNIDRLEGVVLDIGCGKMRYRDLILSSKKVTKYIGLDLDEGKFTYSVRADMYWDGVKIPLDDNSIGSIILLEVLEHCTDPRIVLREAYRILRPNGVIVLTTPFVYHLHGIPYDYQRITPFGIEKMLNELGMSNITITSGGSFDTSLAQMISNWICNRPMPHIIRRILRRLFVPIFKVLLFLDKKNLDKPFKNGTMIPNVFGIAIK